ncbi:ankyrin repeat domain-containing protein [Fluoribacter dumoffii]|uniref:Ribulose-5-phosphate 4-epimerase and related epimerases and aldolases n=1 Tax=Fluoribacter dumoffii TaxID=463 RepID=A0A377GBJ4_9GAMM|nr:Dot/Icm T4SS effector AnkN/AnkX/LegA8 [Fluoribacter dumoffii]KTC90497.1 ankyrin repeat-containing protein [Fluoribacter dumoffii NY 23]MCW8419227.1 ankyrin repeat domain-containing protein [Fluoribacter dumoffii]MCW8452898.1 ankyrin repeat domain-containing protein [Fluoribacter dumoffii]MCW8459852.1 ankyrin repeat domain-containing protein [Fluoribacter dumoffii]MCW8483329.1 ankyrin repeat domain-containing protein [Fluoribacter dumoffii]
MPNLPGLIFLKAYPPEQIWRLLVDGRFWAKEHGWQGYESRERGSINAALESLCSIALAVNQDDEEFELSVRLIKEIHKKCGRKVEELEDKSPGETRTDEPVSFGIPASRASIKGIEEFLQLFFLIKGGAQFGPGKQGPFGPGFDFDYFEGLLPEKIPELAKKIYEDMSASGHNNTTHFFLAVRKNVDLFLDAITQSYNREIKNAKTLDEKLEVIAKHIRQYEVLHPFKDANGRTFVNNLLNILLMQQGLPPATFFEPNVFDLYSNDELVVVIKEAMFNTLQVIENNKKGISLYGYRDTLEDKSKFLEMLDSPSYKKIQGIDLSHVNENKLLKRTKACLDSLNGKLPLHRAAIYSNDPAEVKELVSTNESRIDEQIKQGAPPIFVGKTPAHLAVIMQNMIMIDELIAKKADLSIQDYDGKTILHYAAESGNMVIMGKILTVLLHQKNALEVLQLKDHEGKTAFHYAAEFGSPELVSALTSTDMIEINEADKGGASPIVLAYKNHKLHTFEKLLDSGAKISKELLNEIVIRKDKDTLKKIIAKHEKLLLSKEVFEFAIRLGSISLVKKFLKAGMDINLPITNDNGTPLMMAIGNGDLRLTNFLLKRGADTNLTDKRGYTALHYVFYASPENRLHMIKSILKYNKKVIDTPSEMKQPPLFNAIAVRDFKALALLLDMGARVDYESVEGNNILHSALTVCDISMIQEIASRDNRLFHKKNSEGRTPFHHALNEFSRFRYSQDHEIKMIKICDFLFKERVDLNTEDAKGKTILDQALSSRYYGLCVKLLKAGAHTNISAAADFLKMSEADSILKNPVRFKKELGTMLDENPLIAMSQLNDLYIHIKLNQIRTPKNYLPQGGRLFFKGKSEDEKAHNETLSVLKELYDTKLKELLDNYQGQEEGFAKKHQAIDENLIYLIKNQALSKKIVKPSSQIVEGETYKIKW